jgi:hypothetical protein
VRCTPDRSKLFGSHGQRPWLHDVVKLDQRLAPPFRPHIQYADDASGDGPFPVVLDFSEAGVITGNPNGVLLGVKSRRTR